MTKKIKNAIALAMALGTVASISTMVVSAQCNGNWVFDGEGEGASYCSTPMCDPTGNIPTKYVKRIYVRYCDGVAEYKTVSETGGCCD